MIDAYDRKVMLESALYHLTDQQKFYGTLLQQMTIRYDDRCPTLGLGFNTLTSTFDLMINVNFFHSKTPEQRVALLDHEVRHFTSKHCILGIQKPGSEQMLYNMAADMEINQFIQNLPAGGIDVKDFVQQDPSSGVTTPFPLFKSADVYFDLLKANQKPNKDKLDQYREKGFDEHTWEGLSEEEKEKMLEEAKNIIKRTIEKTQYSSSRVPGELKDLLQELDVMSASLNYKQLLANAIKKSCSAAERESTYARPNRRYGINVPGTKVAPLPKLDVYNDSSGSISVTEQNEYLRILEGFLQAGSRTCRLGFWHTSLYYYKPFKRGQEISQDMLESGGTDVGCVLENIKKTNPNLSIILTDGYYDKVDVSVTAPIIWIISKGGNQNHPMSHLGKTILLENLK